MLSPPIPARRNLRATEGFASHTTTAWPLWARTSAAIRPAGPPPTMATKLSTVSVMLGGRLGARLDPFTGRRKRCRRQEAGGRPTVGIVLQDARGPALPVEQDLAD